MKVSIVRLPGSVYTTLNKLTNRWNLDLASPSLATVLHALSSPPKKTLYTFVIPHFRSFPDQNITTRHDHQPARHICYILSILIQHGVYISASADDYIKWRTTVAFLSPWVEQLRRRLGVYTFPDEHMHLFILQDREHLSHGKTLVLSSEISERVAKKRGGNDHW